MIQWHLIIFNIEACMLLVFSLTHEKKTDLKRFSGFSYRSKLQSNVEFPLSLDLTEFSSDPESELSYLCSYSKWQLFCRFLKKWMYLCKHSKVVRGEGATKKNWESRYYLLYKKLRIIFFIFVLFELFTMVCFREANKVRNFAH